MKQRDFLRRLALAIAIAAVFAVIAWSGLLDGMDGAVSDPLYHRPAATDGEIVVIGIDQYALDTLGPLSGWSRSGVADAINYLCADPDAMPAVIGVDVLYVGESADADAMLVRAAADAGNVVLPSAATFGSDLVTEGSDFYMDTRAVLAWDEPFDALADVTEQGHINAMADGDGILRHMMLYVDAPEVGRSYSFARIIYEKYCEVTGTEANPMPATDADGFFYLPYTTGAGGYYDSVSIADVINGEIEPDYFADKIVLIGPYAAGLQDEYRTSIDHAAPMYGIEVQANQIDAFRNGSIPREVSDTLQLVILVVLCVLALLWFWDRRVSHAVTGWLAVCLGWVGVCLLAYRAGYVLHVLWVPLFITVLFIATVAINYIRAQREKRRVTDTFGRYVDPAILKELLVQGGSAEELGGKMHEVAVLFVDIRGFTTMSESLDPPTVVEIINQYLTLTTECIMRYHGTLDKFVGDCTMAFWNAPLPQEDPVYLACCAAMDMVEGSKELGEKLMERFGRTVSFGVGVHYGPAVIGNIGAPKRMDYTAIGDTVNTASRLESNAPGGKILISRTVADMLGERATTTSLGGSIKLKGKAEGFETLTLDTLDYSRKE